MIFLYYICVNISWIWFYERIPNADKTSRNFRDFSSVLLIIAKALKHAKDGIDGKSRKSFYLI